jgi:hypothetical protein
MKCTDPVLRAQLLAAGANETALCMLEGSCCGKEGATVGAINWAALLQLLVTYGPQILALILALFNPPAPTPPAGT